MQKAIHVYNIKEAHFQEQLKNIMFFIVVVCFGFQEILWGSRQYNLSFVSSDAGL